MSYSYSRGRGGGNTTMVNHHFFESLTSVRLLSCVLLTLAVINLVTFWAVWYWPLLVTMLALFVGIIALRGVEDGYYGAGDWLHLLLFALICVSAIQVLVDIFLIAFGVATSTLQEIFQYMNLVTAIGFVITSFLLRISVLRVFMHYASAGQGITNVESTFGPNPAYNVQIQRDSVSRYIDNNPSQGGSPYTQGEYYRRPQYFGIEARVSSHRLHDPYGNDYEEEGGALPYRGGNSRNSFNRSPPTIRSRMSTDPIANPYGMPYDDDMVEHEPFRNDANTFERNPRQSGGGGGVFAGTEVGATNYGRSRRGGPSSASGGGGYQDMSGLVASPGPRIPAPYPGGSNNSASSYNRQGSTTSSYGRRVSFRA